jgi:hypothetical protein
MNSISVFALNGISVELDKDFISLNKLWEMAGNPENQDPRQWARLPQTIRLISQVLTEQGFQDNKENRKFVVVVKRGKCGYTKAIPAIAAEYELYLKKTQRALTFGIREKNIQAYLARKLKGKIEIKTLAGFIDILTQTEIIEVKNIREWKSALGQILVYGDYYPSHQKRIHLFGETEESFLNMVRQHCEKRGVKVTWQKI